MKTVYTMLIAAVMALSAFAADGDSVWLIRHVQIENDAGIKGYPVGTMFFKEGEQFRSGNELIKLPKDAFTDDFKLAEQIAKGNQEALKALRAKQAAAEAKLKESEAAKAKTVDSAPKVPYTTPQPTNLKGGGLQTSQGLGNTKLK